MALLGALGNTSFGPPNDTGSVKPQLSFSKASVKELRGDSLRFCGQKKPIGD
jgi:hypothetical protein